MCLCLSDIFYTLYTRQSQNVSADLIIINVRFYVATFIKQPDFSGIVHINLQNVFMFAIMPNSCVCSLLKNKNILTHKTVGWAYSAFQGQCSVVDTILFC